MSQDKEKLLKAVNDGSMTEIAVNRVLAEVLEKRREQSINHLIDIFNENKLGNELIAATAEIVALEKIEIDLRTKIVNGHKAAERLELMEQEKHEQENHNRNYEYEGV